MGIALGAKVFSSSMAVSTSTENDASWASPLQFLSGPNRNQAHEIASSQHLGCLRFRETGLLLRARRAHTSRPTLDNDP